MTVQAILCQTLSDLKFLVFSRTGSYVFYDDISTCRRICWYTGGGGGGGIVQNYFSVFYMFNTKKPKHKAIHLSKNGSKTNMLKYGLTESSHMMVEAFDDFFFEIIGQLYIVTPITTVKGPSVPLS